MKLLRPLSPRQSDVLRNYCAGMNDKESGHALGIRPCTMKVHWRIILRKFRARTRGQAVVFWVRMRRY